MHRSLRMTATIMALGLTLASCVSQPQGASYRSMPQEPYTLGSGDRLRITVFGQPSLSTTYGVDAEGVITMPLIGGVEAAGRSPYELQKTIEQRLKAGFLREPSVSVEVESYRPFFIMGEVTSAGQYPYVAGMTVENAIAIAGGFGPRARKDLATITRKVSGQSARAVVPLSTPVRPGDVITIGERWF